MQTAPCVCTLHQTGGSEAVDSKCASSLTFFGIFWLLKMTEAELFKDINRVACTQSSFINFSISLFFFYFMSADGLTAARTQEETGLILLSYVVSITSLLYKGGSLMAWRVHSTPLPALLSQFEPHERKRAWRRQRRRIRLCGLSWETSAAERYSLEGDVLQCGASSPRGGSSIRHNLLFTIYRISPCP